jgi:uncharacterized protein (TIGR02444 family)
VSAILNLSLWDFSLQLYSQPEVEPLCLELQDSYGVDINMLLWCEWLEQQHKCLTLDRLQMARMCIAPWKAQTVLPLRELRRELKNRYGTSNLAVEKLRQTIKQAELQAEQQTQTLLEELAESWPVESVAIPNGDNLRIYLRECKLPAPKMAQACAQLSGITS